MRNSRKMLGAFRFVAGFLFCVDEIREFYYTPDQ